MRKKQDVARNWLLYRECSACGVDFSVIWYPDRSGGWLCAACNSARENAAALHAKELGIEQCALCGNIIFKETRVETTRGDICLHCRADLIKQLGEQRYRHIYLGEPIPDSDTALTKFLRERGR